MLIGEIRELSDHRCIECDNTLWVKQTVIGQEIRCCCRKHVVNGHDENLKDGCDLFSSLIKENI